MRHRTTIVNDKEIPTASRTKVVGCPDGHVHLLAQDDDGEPMFEIVLGLTHLQMILETAEENGMLDTLGNTPCPSEHTN